MACKVAMLLKLYTSLMVSLSDVCLCKGLQILLNSKRIFRNGTIMGLVHY